MDADQDAEMTLAGDQKPLSTAAIADASIKLGVPVRLAPTQMRPLFTGLPFSGPAQTVTHQGSVDAILEVIDSSQVGDVLVIDNGGRQDEACIGDLLVAEAAFAGIVGIALWGLHRDSAQLHELRLPLHSLGATPVGPQRIPANATVIRAATFDSVPISDGDLVIGDDDGVLFLRPEHRSQILDLASTIQEIEQRQAQSIADGHSLREQLEFSKYQDARRQDATLTFRAYLADRNAAFEA